MTSTQPYSAATLLPNVRVTPNMRECDEYKLTRLCTDDDELAAADLVGMLENDARHDLETQLGGATAVQLRAAFELGRRYGIKSQHPHGEVLGHPGAVMAWARHSLVGLDHEELWVLGVDAKNCLRSARMVARGGTFSATVRARDVLREILREGSPGFILVHNHPSGDPEPSPEDLTFTTAIAKAALVVGVPLLDHVIVGKNGFQSLSNMIEDEL